MSDRSAIELHGVWKRYFRGGLGNYLRGTAYVWAGKEEAAPGAFWALRDFSCSVPAGETLGIIGPNGAGKTTALKLLCGVSKPTRGTVTTRGRIGALINLGAGFHGELTGRENIYLKGVIMGMTRREVASKLDQIVEFSDLGVFLDTPVRHYSSGMYARLGFSVAAFLDPDILLIDEVLSVGDLNFQSRCFERMAEFRKRGIAIVFVSHGLSAVAMICQRVIWLDRGQIVQVGPPSEVVSAYVMATHRAILERPAPGGAQAYPVEVDKAVLMRDDGASATRFQLGEPLRVQLMYISHRRIERPRFSVAIRSYWGYVFIASMVIDGTTIPVIEGRGSLECRFASLPLLPGVYQAVLSVVADDGYTPLIPHDYPLGTFELATDPAQYGFHSPAANVVARYSAPTYVPYRWIF